MSKLYKGIVQVYTGNGKGKTTAAMGLAMRAAGQGLKVYILQFLKPQRLSSGEIRAQKYFQDHLTIERLKTPWWSLKSFKRDDHKKRLKKILIPKIDKLRNIILSEEYDLIILDEINNCLHHGLVSIDSILRLIKEKPPKIELVLTGRDAPEEIIKMADLVTEMKCRKHPYQSNLKARKGIEY